MSAACRLRARAISPAIVLLALLHAPAGAEDRKLSADEIEQVLAGNTIEGLWAGRPYKQYFSETGNTIYAEDGRQPSKGRWKADPDKEAYCSWWEMSGWSCYEVLDGGPDAIIWVSPGSGERHPATVLPGRQL